MKWRSEMPTLAERVICALDEIQLMRAVTVPADYPEWQKGMADASRDMHLDRANALERQINDVIAVLAERGLILK